MTTMESHETRVLGAKWSAQDKHKAVSKPENSISKAVGATKKKLNKKKYPKALVHQEPELYSLPPPAPKFKVVAESVPIPGLDEPAKPRIEFESTSCVFVFE